MNRTYHRRDVLRILGVGTALGGAALLGACGGSGGNEAPREQIASSLSSTTPENQAATFRNADRIVYSRTIKRGATTMPLKPHHVSLASLTYDYAGKTTNVDDYMQRNRTAGLLILKGGAVALERYGMGNTETSRWTSWSVAKSVTSTLVGAALKDGHIASLDDPVTRYVTALKGSAYEQNTIRELLRMTSGVRWIETYSGTGDSDIARLGEAEAEAYGSGKSGSVMELMRTRPRAAAPGSVFNYSTGESYVLGAVVAAATGTTLSDYFSRKVWAPFGMEADGYWQLDSEGGLEMGGENFSATLRDYGRFGLFFSREGVVNGTAVLPLGWRALAGHPDSPVTNYGALYEGYPLGYGYQWWGFPGKDTTIPAQDRPFTAQGIYGQFIYINPKEDVVAVVWSAWNNSEDESAQFETYALLSKAVEMLK